MEKNTKVILIFFLAIFLLVAVMYFSIGKIGNNKEENNIFNLSNGFFPLVGSGSIKIIEFSDFACPVCRIQEPILKEAIKDYGYRISLYYRNFPLPMHENSFLASLASACANEQDKFWQYHDLLFENQGKFNKEDLKNYASQLSLNKEQFNSCLDSEKYKTQVQQDIDEGIAAGVAGTPTFFVNGKRYEGFQNLENFRSIIEQEK